MISKEKILHSISLDHKLLLKYLISWSNINSHTFNHAGLECLKGELKKAFKGLNGTQVSVKAKAYEEVDDRGQVKKSPLGDILTVTKRPRAPLQILCVCHMDTVYQQDSSFQKTTLRRSGILKGPGVADAKGGIAVMLSVLRAIESSGIRRHVGWRAVINADEEIGSPGSASILMRYAKDADLGLVFEPALPGGALVNIRKGSGNFVFIIRGVAAHAGRAFYQGKNAIEAASEASLMLSKLSGKRNGLTVNVGKISGGDAVNIVPDLAIIRFNVRIKEKSDQRFVNANISSIIKNLNRKKGIRALVKGSFGACPKIPGRKDKIIYRDLAKCANTLGQKISFKPSGGVCDSNRLALVGLPVIDGAGVCGGNIHSTGEFMYVNSLTERAKLVALYLARLAQGTYSL